MRCGRTVSQIHIIALSESVEFACILTDFVRAYTVYFEGTAPPYMRGREKEEIYYYPESQTGGKPTRDVVGVSQLDSNSKTDSLGRLEK